MALTVQVQPQDIILSGNPATLTVSSNTVTQSNHKIHVEILQGELKIGEEEAPLLNNSATFDVSDYLKKNVKTNFSIFDFLVNKVQLASNRLTSFKLRVYETYNGDGIQHNKLFLASFYVIEGGFSRIFQKNYLSSGKKFYNNFLLDEKRFLTWSPQKKITVNQYDFLYFIYTGSTQYIRARLRLFFDDNTTSEVYSLNYQASSMHMYFVNTSYLAYELENQESSKKIIKYEVVIIRGSSVEITETKTYYIDRNTYNNSRHIVFRNSLGGYDIICLKGVSEQNNSIERTIGYFQTKDDVSNSKFKENFQAASGFMLTQYNSVEDARNYITELINSKEIYEIVGKNIIPVIPTSKKFSPKRDGEFLFSFTFEYQYAYSDEYFSPFEREQYVNPRILYENGEVTPSPVDAGQTATLNFDITINDNVTVDFEINWGDGIGTTLISGEVISKDLQKSLTSSIVIPANVEGTRNVLIIDSLGGVYEVEYYIGDFEMLFETGEPMLFEDGEQMLFENI